MEFLVRLENKVNIQVFCLNPAHKGNHMDRFFYEDPTFNAPCPECGSSEWLYRKNNAISKKGHFITYKPDGWDWQRLEGKHFGIVRIDCTEEQASAWCEGIGVQDPENIASIITYRPRKFAFDFEKVLTSEQLKNWNDLEAYSEIISTQNTAQIKDATYAIDAG